MQHATTDLRPHVGQRIVVSSHNPSSRPRHLQYEPADIAHREGTVTEQAQNGEHDIWAVQIDGLPGDYYLLHVSEFTSIA